MRIIAGTKRGMKLFAPKGGDTRPVTDKVKESLFNVIQKYGLPEGAVTADLFCGIGSLGLETLSRGGEFVTFLEKDPRVLAVLNKNINKAGFENKSNVIKADAFRIGAPVGPEKTKYTLVFVDPPYAATENVGPDSALGSLLHTLSGQVAAGAIVIVRTRRNIRLLDEYSGLAVIDSRRWGSMTVTILQKKNYDQ